MFKSIFLFELNYRLKRPATYIYMLIMFLFGFLVMASGGVSTGEKTNFNAPSTIGLLVAVFSVFGSLISSAIMSVPIYRDIEHKTQNFLFTLPIKERTYLLGRFLGSFSILILIPIANLVGLWLGSIFGPIFGWEEADRFGPNSFSNYAIPFFTYGLINYFFTGTIFFALVAKTRNVFAAYMGSILFLISYLVVGGLMQNLDNRKWAVFLDPFYLNGWSEDTRYLTTFERNNFGIPLTSNLFYNRLLYGLLTILVFAATYFSFSFRDFFVLKQAKPKATKKEEIKPNINVLNHETTKNFTFLGKIRNLFSLFQIEYLSIVRDKFFWVMLIGGFVTLMVDNWNIEELYGTPSLPVTYYMLEGRGFNFTIFVWVMLLFFTGEVIHRNKSLNFNQIYDALPVPDWVTYLAKVKAIGALALMLAFLVMVAGILTQILKGYFVFDLALYLKSVLFVFYPEYLQIVMLAIFVHVIVNSKFAGHFIGIAVWIIMIGIRIALKTDFNLFFYSYMPNYTISDFNGFGHFVEPLIYYTFYWISVGFCLLALGYFFWVRGAESNFKARWQSAFSLMFGQKKIIWLLLPLTIAITLGSVIYYNTNVLNRHIPFKQGLDYQASYERQFKQYEYAAQPKYTAIKLNAHLYPSDRKVIAHYETKITNKDSVAIDTLFFTLSNFRMQFTLDDKLLPFSYVSEPFYSTNDAGKGFVGLSGTRFVKIALPRPLEPNQIANLLITDTTEVLGFGNSDLNWRINQNGTFIDATPPSFGYVAGLEIDSDSERKKRGFEPKNFDQLPHNDPRGYNVNLFNESADLVDFEAIISTEIDQIAIAPGYLQSEWVVNERRFFHYKSDEQIDLFYAIVSGRYAVVKDKVDIGDKTVVLEIYHHPKHTQNLNHFMDGLKDALIYNSKNFSPFQHKQLRIIEFPRYASFAQSFPNTIPFSEDFGWQANFKDPNNYNYAYYVTAHEVGHQWWGHQVLPSATRGANLISESLAEYSAIMVAEKKYGAENLRKFLQYSMDRYLSGRANESKSESNYIDCNRPYQWYQKGSLLFYATKDYLGEDVLNNGLQSFLSQFSVNNPPYATSYDLYDAVKKVTPDSLHYFIDEGWKKITLYNNRVISAKSKKLENGKYEIKMVVNTQKTYADSTGKEKPGIYKNDWIDIGVFADDSTLTDGRKVAVPIYLQKHLFTLEGDKEITLQLGVEPKKVGIDPFNKLIDRITDDNQIKVLTE